MLSAYRGNANAVSPAASGKPILVTGATLAITPIPDATSLTPVAANTLQEMICTQAAGTLTINAPTGTAADGMRIILRIQCTNAQTLSFNGIYRGSNDVALPGATTGSSKYDYLGFMYNAAAVKWDMLAKVFGF